MLNMIHYSLYAGDGQGSPGAVIIGGYGELLGQILFMALLLLLSLGWTITTEEMRNKMIVFSVIFVYAVLYHAMFIFQIAAYDPGSNLMSFQARRSH